MLENGTSLRQILHVDMDAFFVSVEELLNPSLKNKPVIVGGNPDGRGVVAAASYTARKFGIHSAMPVAKAKRLCPHAVFLRGSGKRYSEYSKRVFKILRSYSPLVEPMSLDEAFIDLTGCDRLYGPVLESAEKIRKEIRGTLGLNASIGIASNKLLSKIASAYCKPNGMLWIAPGMEQKFLAPLSIRRVPGIGPKGAADLEGKGIKSVGDLAGIPFETLVENYGKWGESLFRKARGLSDSPVFGDMEDPRSISRETTFEKDSTDPVFLESTLSYLTEKAAAQLRGKRLFAGTETLKLRNSNFKTVTRSKTLDAPSADDYKLFQTGMGLFRSLYTTRKQVRLIGIAFHSLTTFPHRQGDLFESPRRKNWDDLYQGIDHIRNKYGFKYILRATSNQRQAG